MSKKVWILIFIGLLCTFPIIDTQARKRSNPKKPMAREELDIQFAEDVIETSLAEEIGEAEKEEPYDIEAKRKMVINLVKDATTFLKEKPIYQAFHAFTHDQQFKRGELYLFAYDLKGHCLAHGQYEDFLWKNNYDLRDQYGMLMVQAFISVAKKQDSGWITYQWRNAAKETYIKKVSKEGEDFIICSGFYPHSKKASVVNLVKGAVALFNQDVQEGNRIDRAFSILSYPIGRFILGDLYLYALSFAVGKTMAHGERPGLIGTDALDYRDTTGRYVNKEIIEKLQKTSEGVWVEYLSKRAPKKSYAEKITDQKGNNYFIACGYYPDAGQKQAVDLVRKGYVFMKAHGLSQTVEEFSDLANNMYRYGDLYLEVYNYQGICKAHGVMRDLIGRNMYNVQDEDGRYYVREIIAKSKAGGGWVNYKHNNLFRLVYVEPIDLGVDKFAILSGVYPISKMETMMLLAKSAASYLQAVSVPDALGEFVKQSSRYISGDLSVFVFDSTGICLAWGDDYDYIWKNMIDVKDDDGREYVKLLINTGMRGSGKVSYKLNGMPVVAYVEKVEKEGRTLIVGSHYYK